MRLRFWLAIVLVLAAPAVQAQYTSLLRLDPADSYGGPLAIDRGIVGLRQRLMELRTTASVMQVTAHPDDEQAGLLTYFSRGTGARTALLSLNRGEAGANAVGPELFDALGLLRERELTLAATYYGLDDLYFTNAVDYGYSKSMVEAARSFDTAAVLREMVEIIRWNRPLVVISRWSGSARDGHGQHQLAGALVPLAVAAAADPTKYPGTPPWRVRLVFRSNLPADLTADVTIDAGRFDPVLGESYQSIGATGLSLQRSQTAGRRGSVDSLAPQRLQWVAGLRATSSNRFPRNGVFQDTAPRDIFAGIDTSIAGIFALTGEAAPDSAAILLQTIEDASRMALDSLAPGDPQAIVRHLRRGMIALERIRQRTGMSAQVAKHLLDVKQKQFERAVATAIGLEIRAVAHPPGGDRAVVGDSIPVEITLRHAATLAASIGAAFAYASPRDLTPGNIEHAGAAHPNVTTRLVRYVRIGAAASTVSRPPFSRASIAQNHYEASRPSFVSLVDEFPAIGVQLFIAVEGTALFPRVTARYARPDEPFGLAFPALAIVPPVSLHVEPSVKVVTGAGARRTRVEVVVKGNSRKPVDTNVFLSANGKRLTASVPARVSIGQSHRVPFDVVLPAGSDSLTLTATAQIDTMLWTDDVTDIVHRDLEPARLHTKATSRIQRVPVTIRPGLRVGYIMGVGDVVPDAIRQLGANVTLLDSTQLSSGNFKRYDAIVVGTRAYAVRDDLVRGTPALLEWAKGGGNLVVLYQTQEFKPETMAPFHALLPGNAEEVTEQDAPVQVLSPNNPLLSTPNRITTRDFDGWIEQRGSKFLTELAPEYTALVETHDTGQSPQRGIWVTANVGRGRWTYVALALHRQLPYAVPGAYRILANLLSSR